MSKWIKWFASFLYESSKTEKEFTENLAVSLSVIDSPSSGWCLIESDDDIRTDLQNKKEKKARESELKQVVGQLNIKGNNRKDFTKTFADLLVTLPDDASDSSFVALPSDMRVSIVNRIMKLRGRQWLEFMEKVFFEIKSRTGQPISTQDTKLLEDLRDSWVETPYAKGRLGALRDFTMLSYTEDRLTPKMLRAVHSSLVKSIQVLFRVQLQCTLEPADVNLIEDSMAVAIPDLIALHVQSARIWAKNHDNEGKLPQKWREEDIKVAQKLKEIKEKGVDAKWEEPKPYNAKLNVNERASLDLHEAAQILNTLLSKQSGSDSEDADLSPEVLQRLKVQINDEERMNRDDIEHRKSFLMHTLFSPRRLSTRQALNAHA